jgi:peptidoglycan/LPS O-acetylase OafA/YrhL
LDRVPADAPFQLWAPFGFFPSRLGAYLLGMVGASALVQNAPRVCGALLGTRALLAGLAAWLVGNTLLYAGRWGWIFADFVLALGLTLVLINLARYAQRRRPNLFAALSRLGQWSYPIFLTHLVFGQTYALAYPALGDNAALRIALLGGALLATVVTAWLLVRLEASPWPALLMRRLMPFLARSEDRNAASGREAMTAAP